MAVDSKRRIAFYAMGSILLVVAVIAGEVIYALKAPRLPQSEPFDLRRVGEGTQVTWLGDSTAAGVGATGRDQTVPMLVAGVADDITSLAVSGATLADVLAEQAPRVPPTTERIYISVGANDTTHLTNLDEFEGDYRALLDALPENAEVVVLGVPDMGSPPRFLQPLRAVAGFRGRQLDEIVQRSAQASGATYIDIEGRTGPDFRDDPGRYFADDNFHPSDDGYRLWADAVRKNQ